MHEAMWPMMFYAKNMPLDCQQTHFCFIKQSFNKNICWCFHVVDTCKTPFENGVWTLRRLLSGWLGLHMLV